MAKVPSVLVSYSWDDTRHKNWVRLLASRLVSNGIRVWLDQWHVRPGESLTAFMEQKIEASGHILIICTPTYARKSNTRRGGVGYEQQIISGRISAGILRRKFIPILRRGQIEPGPDCAIPTHFAGIMAIDMRSSAAYRGNFEQLLRAIYNKPKHVPPVLGKSRLGRAEARRAPPRRATAVPKLVAKGATRLPVLEVDGWRLDSGVVRNQLHPRTFWIPPQARRNKIRAGDVVKLPFEIAVRKRRGVGPIAGERMWVDVKGQEGPYYVGKLANDPVTSDEQRVLRHGSRVVFLPENVIDITTAAEVRLTKRQNKRGRGIGRKKLKTTRPNFVRVSGRARSP